MSKSPRFRDAFLEHLARTGQTVAEVARWTGIPRGQLDKLRQGRTKSTNVDDAIEIAHFFGKTVNDFIGLAPDDKAARFTELFSQLEAGEQDFLLRQLEGAALRSGRKR